MCNGTQSCARLTFIDPEVIDDETQTRQGLGWALFGLSFFLARCVPRPVSALLIASGLYGWQALTAPKLVPLALAWGTLGALLWLEDREGSRTL